MEIIKFKARGLVLGNYWGGGSGSYPAKSLTANTKEELLELANKALNNGSLDSGMGYDSLIGGILEITKITTVIIDDKEFTNEEHEIEFIGTLKVDEEEFLENCWHQSY